MPALALLLGLVVAWSARFSSTPKAPVRVVAPDAVVISAGVGDQQVVPVALGMGSEIGDPLDTPDNSIARVLHAARLQVLRFGDIYADDYDWEVGCSYGDNAQRECSGAPGKGSALDRFLQFAAQVGVHPLIVVNGEVDDPQKAARLVAYYQQHCAGGASPRPQFHCLQPYWEIGASPATWKHFAVPLAQRQSSDASVIQPDQYAALVISYAAAMRRVDPSIRIIADDWITGATDQGWVADVSAVDTHYAPLPYSSSESEPSVGMILNAVQQGTADRPGGIDAWLQAVRDSLAQFSDSSAIGLIVGRWSIDPNTVGTEPQVYSGYAQALFAGVMLTHLWQDAYAGGRNPLLMAIQYPIVGSGQEPFDFPSYQPRPAMAVYALVGRHFGAYPRQVSMGTAVRAAGVLAAAATNGRQVSVLLVNTSEAHSFTIGLQGLPSGPCELWWVGPTKGASAASGPGHSVLSSARVTLPPWSIAVVQAG